MSDQPPEPPQTPLDPTECQPPPPPPGRSQADPFWLGGTAAPDPAGPSWAAAPAAARHHVLRTTVAIVVAVLFVATGSVAVGLYALRGSGEDLTRMIPASADVYVSIDFDPSLQQKLNVDRLAQKFPSLHGTEGVDKAVDSAMDDALSGMVSGVSFHRDVRPWLGSQIALVGHMASGSDDAIVLASKDDAAAQRFLDTVTSHGPAWEDLSYKGVTLHVGRSGSSVRVVTAFVDHAVVIGGTISMVEQVIAADQGGPRLDQTPGFTTTVRTLPSERLALVYVSTAPLRRTFAGLGGLGALDGAPARNTLGLLAAARGLGVSLSAQPDGVAVDANIPIDASKLTADERKALTSAGSYRPLLTWVPEGSFGFFASPAGVTSPASALDQVASNASPELRHMLSTWHVSGPDGVAAHLTGDAVVEFGPSAESVAGTVILGTDDEASTRTALDQAAPAIARSITSGALGPIGGATPPMPKGLSKAQRRQFRKMLGGPTKPPTVRWTIVSHGGTQIHVATAVQGSLSHTLFAYTVADGAAIVSLSASSIEDALAAHEGGSNASTDAAVSEALRQSASDQGAIFYVDLGRVVAFAGSSGAQVPAELQALRSVVVSSRTSTDGVAARVFVAIR